MTTRADVRGGSTPPRTARRGQWFVFKPWLYDVDAGWLLRAAPPQPLPLQPWARAYGLIRDPACRRAARSSRSSTRRRPELLIRCRPVPGAPLPSVQGDHYGWALSYTVSRPGVGGRSSGHPPAWPSPRPLRPVPAGPGPGDRCRGRRSWSRPAPCARPLTRMLTSWPTAAAHSTYWTSSGTVNLFFPPVRFGTCSLLLTSPCGAHCLYRQASASRAARRDWRASGDESRK